MSGIVKLGALCLGLAPGIVYAGGSTELHVADLAKDTGMQPRQIQMVLGARTAFAEYRVSYDRLAARFERALGKERYQDLISGREITLDSGVRVQLAAR